MPYLLYFFFTDYGTNLIMRRSAIGLLLCIGCWLMWLLYRSFNGPKT